MLISEQLVFTLLTNFKDHLKTNEKTMANMLMPEFIASEIQEWVDSNSTLSKEQKELFIEFALRLFQSYEYYRKLVTGTPDS